MALLNNFINSIFTDAGMPVQAAITVYEAGTINLVSIYRDKDGAVPETNPFNTDAVGRFHFFAQVGIFYDIKVSGTGIQTYTLEDVTIPLIA